MATIEELLMQPQQPAPRPGLGNLFGRIITGAAAGFGGRDVGGQIAEANRLQLARNEAQFGRRVALAKLLRGQHPEPYTLGPGQTRFGPDNAELASVPAADARPAQPKMFREGPDYVTRLLNPDGTPGREVARSKITGLTEFDVAAGEPGKVERTAAGVAARSSATTIQDLASLMGATETTPGAFGARGAIGEAAGGIAQQVHPALGEAVSRGITGAGTKDVATVRTEQRKIVTSLLPQISNDTSGRYSDQDVKRAQAIAGSGWEKSPEQVKGAMMTLLQIEVQSYYRNLSIAGLQPEFDLNSKEGIDMMGDHLMNDLGMDYKTAVETVRNVRESYMTLPKTGVR